MGTAPAAAGTITNDALTDGQLIEAIRAGTVDAYDELYRRHSRAVQRFARRMCRDEHTAADVAADVFANTLRAIRAGRGPHGEFIGYVLRAVRNQAARQVTRGDGARAVPIEQVVLDAVPADDASGRDDIPAAIGEAFERLPERFRVVLWETEVEGRSHHEIASRHDIAASAVAALAYRARRALGRQFLHASVARTGTPRECEATISLLASYVRNEVAATTRRRIERHLAGCPTCRAATDEMRTLNATLRSVPWLATGALLTGKGRVAHLVDVVARWSAHVAAPSHLAATAATGLVGMMGIVAPVGVTPDVAADGRAAHVERVDHDHVDIATLPPAGPPPRATGSSVALPTPSAPHDRSDTPATMAVDPPASPAASPEPQPAATPNPPPDDTTESADGTADDVTGATSVTTPPATIPPSGPPASGTRPASEPVGDPPLLDLGGAPIDLPDIDLSGTVEIDLGVDQLQLGVVDAGGLPLDLPDVTVPALSIPALSIPSISIPAIETPVVDLPAVETPAVETPALGLLPALDVGRLLGGDQGLLAHDGGTLLDGLLGN